MLFFCSQQPYPEPTIVNDCVRENVAVSFAFNLYLSTLFELNILTFSSKLRRIANANEWLLIMQLKSHRVFGDFSLLILKYNQLKLYKTLLILSKRQWEVAFFRFRIANKCFV